MTQSIVSDRDRLIWAMDTRQPDWWISFADQTDLADLARGTARDTIRVRVAEKLMMPIGAALDAGIVGLTNSSSNNS